MQVSPADSGPQAVIRKTDITCTFVDIAYHSALVHEMVQVGTSKSSRITAPLSATEYTRRSPYTT